MRQGCIWCMDCSICNDSLLNKWSQAQSASVNIISLWRSSLILQTMANHVCLLEPPWTSHQLYCAFFFLLFLTLQSQSCWQCFIRLTHCPLCSSTPLTSHKDRSFLCFPWCYWCCLENCHPPLASPSPSVFICLLDKFLVPLLGSVLDVSFSILIM